MSIQYNQQIDFEQKTSVNPSHNMRRVLPLSTGQSLTPSLTSTVSQEYELPNLVMNLSKSILKLDLVLPTTGDAGHYPWLQALGFSIFDSVRLVSRSGTVLCDLSHANYHVSMTSGLRTSKTELADKSCGSITASNSTYALTPIGDIAPSNDVGVNYNPTALGTGAGVGKAYITPRELYRGHPHATVGTGISFELELGSLKETIFDVNKNLYFGENVLLQLTYAPIDTYVWKSTANNNPGTGSASIGGAPVFNNCELYIATESDPVIINQIVSKANSAEGLVVPFGYSYIQKIASSVATQHTLSQRVSRAYGSTLLRAYYAVYNNDELLETAFLHPQTGVITSYNTNLNGQKNQNYLVDCTRNLHYLTNKSNIKDSALDDLAHYNFSFVHVDNYAGVPVAHADNSQRTGLDLNEDRIIGFECTTASSAYKLYCIFVCQRTLVVSGGRPSVI